MCVIIYLPKGNSISRSELSDAWRTNPDGAGLAYVDGGHVHFKRGFLKFEEYYKAVAAIQGRHDTVLHLRISTCAGVSAIGTHPYKAGDVLKLQGCTTAPVICMNGVIYGQTLKKKNGHRLNDTASYIVEHEAAFSVINADVLGLIADNTGAKWAAATPDGVLLSEGFIERSGRYYSNINHIWAAAYYTYDYLMGGADDDTDDDDTDALLLEHLLEPALLHEVKKDSGLHTVLTDHVDTACNTYSCKYCIDCLSDCRTIDDLWRFIQVNYYRSGLNF